MFDMKDLGEADVILAIKIHTLRRDCFITIALY